MFGLKRNVAHAARPLAGAPPAIASAVGVLAAIAVGAAMVVAMGLASVVWVPLLLLTGSVMCTVWVARRRRQTLEGRDANDLKDPLHADRRWPKGVIDDRLPEP